MPDLEYDHTIVVHAAPEAIYRIVAEPQDYAPPEVVAELVKEVPGPTRSGTRWRESVRLGPLFEIRTRTVATAVDPPRSLTMLWSGPLMHGDLTYSITPGRGGTRFRQRETMTAEGALRPLAFLAAASLGKRLTARMNDVAALAESDGGGDGRNRSVELRKRRDRRPAAGYFRNGMAYARYGRGSRDVIVFEGLMPENSPPTALTRAIFRPYRFLEREWTVWVVLRKRHMPPGYTLREMAADYAAMIEAEFGGAQDVIGVSTGGSIALHFAADHPHLVRRLVLHSAAHTLSGPGRQFQRRLAAYAEAGSWDRFFRDSFSFLWPPRRGAVGRAQSAALDAAAGLLGRLAFPKDPADFVVTVAAEDRHDFRRRLGEITAPTLVVAGDQDPVYSPVLVRETAAGIPDSRLVLYRGVGHPAAGKEFENEVRAFIRGEPRGQAGP